MPFQRIAGIAGLTFVGLLLVVNTVMGVAGRPFETTTPIDEVVTWFEENARVVDVLVAAAPIIWVAMTLFGVGVLCATRGTDRGWSPWALVGLVGVTMQHAIFSGVVGTDAVLAAGQTDVATSSVVWQLHHAPFSLNSASIAMALGGFAVAALGSGLAPRWTRWVALVGVLGLLANAMQTALLLRGDGFFVLGIVGFLCWATFAAAVSVRLLRGNPVGSPGAESESAATGLLRHP